MDQQCHGGANNANVCTYLLLQATHFIKQANARKHQKKKEVATLNDLEPPAEEERRQIEGERA